MRKNRGKIAIFLVPDLSRSNPFARNEGRCAKIELKLRFYLCRTCPGATLSHEMRIDRKKLRWNYDFTCAGATLSHEMRVDRETEGKIASLLVLEQPFPMKWWSIVKNWRKTAIFLVPDLSRSNPFARNEGRSAKIKVKLRFYLYWSNPFARNEGRSSKTEEKMRVYLSWSNPFARNDGRSSETEVKCDFSCAGLVLEQPFRTKWKSIGKN